MNELTQQGIDALRSGDREAARQLLAAAIKQDPNDAAAWLWLAGALSKDEERIQCLQQVLRIDPGNAVASRGLAQILERRTRPQAEAAAAASQAAQAEQPEAAATTPTGDPATPVTPATTVAPTPVAPATPVTPATTVAPPAGPVMAETVMVEMAAGEAAQKETAQQAAVEPSAFDQKAVLPQQPAEGRRRRPRAYIEGEQVIFKTRPSVVPALIGFWVFLIGAIAIGVLLQSDPVLSLSLAVGMGFILEVIVIYAAIRNLTARYEVTNYQITLRFRGQRVRVQVADILTAECRQTFFQKILGTGNLLLDASVRGELVHLRMRNIPECDRRLKQVQALIPTS